MADENWVSLAEYSSKYKISLSTLRRRIRNNHILFKFEHGRYWIADDGESVVIEDGGLSEDTADYQEASASLVEDNSDQEETVLYTEDEIAAGTESGEEGGSSARQVEASIIGAAHRLVDDLKEAYMKILQEKEEQISILRDEIVDLKMLVRVLEEKDKAQVGPSANPTTSPNEDSLFFSQEIYTGRTEES